MVSGVTTGKSPSSRAITLSPDIAPFLSKSKLDCAIFLPSSSSALK